jgi:hypothetical protein
MTPVFIKQGPGFFKEVEDKVIPKKETIKKDILKEKAKEVIKQKEHKVEDFNYKKYYDQPLSISKTNPKKIATEKPQSDINNYKTNLKNYTVNHSRGSSIYESYSNEIAGSNRTNDGVYNNNYIKPAVQQDTRLLTGGFNESDKEKLNSSKSFQAKKAAKTDERSEETRNYPFKSTNSGVASKYSFKSPMIITKNDYTSSINRKKSKIY